MEINDILTDSKTIAVVGLSGDPKKESFRVAAYLKRNGYRIIPVNPNESKVLGEKSYPNLLHIPLQQQKTIDVVDIFRKAADVPPIVQQAIEMKKAVGRRFVVWMQKGIVNESAAEMAREAGLIVVMDRCLMVEHRRQRRAAMRRQESEKPQSLL
jgi:predicted CoA-binding protein